MPGCNDQPLQVLEAGLVINVFIRDLHAMNEKAKAPREKAGNGTVARGRPAARAKVHALDQSSRERLLEAAISLFTFHGFDAVSTGMVAQAAGLTQSMVHYHFRSKAKLWKAAMDRMMHDRGSVFPAELIDLRDLDPLSRLKVLARRFLMASAQHPEIARIGVHEGMVRTARLRWFVRRYAGTTYQMFDQAIEEAMDQGLIKRHPVHQVTTIIMMGCAMPFTVPVWIKQVYGVSVTDPDEVEAYSDTLISVLFNGLEISPK